MKDQQKDFLTKNSNYQKETMQRIEAGQEEAQRIVSQARTRQIREYEALSKAEKMDTEISKKKEENNVNDLFKSIVHQETSQRKELEQEIFGKTSEQKTGEAPKTTAPVQKNLAQQQTAGLLRGMNKMKSEVEQKQYTIMNKQAEHEMQQ